MVLCLCLDAATLSAAPARTAAPSPKDRAQLLLDRAAARLNASDPAEAQRLAEEAYRHYPSPKILYLMAQCARAQGAQVEAADLARRYLASPEVEPERARECQQLLSRLREPGLTGEIQVDGPPGALLSVDGRLVGALPLARPLLCRAGTRALRLEEGGAQQAPVQVHVSPGALVPQRLPPPPETATLRVHAGPDLRADLHLDGKDVGPLPFAGSVPRAEHTVRVTARDQILYEGRLHVRRDPTDLALFASRQRPPAWRIGVGTSAAAAGLAMVGVGAAALSINGHCVPAETLETCVMGEIAPGMIRPLLYETIPAGTTLVVLGGALAGVGVALSLLPGPLRLRAMRPAPAGRVVLLSW